MKEGNYCTLALFFHYTFTVGGANISQKSTLSCQDIKQSRKKKKQEGQKKEIRFTFGHTHFDYSFGTSLTDWTFPPPSEHVYVVGGFTFDVGILESGDLN